MKIKVEMEYEVTAELLSEIFIGFIESGDPVTVGWCSEVTTITPRPTGEGPWYANPEYWKSDFTVLITEDEDDGDPKHLINNTRVAAGIKMFAMAHPKDFLDLVNEQGDAGIYDLVVQYIVFGEEKYS